MGNIKDFILPRKKDRYGWRIDFIKTSSRGAAGKLIKLVVGSRLMGSILKADFSMNKDIKSGMKNLTRSADIRSKKK